MIISCKGLRSIGKMTFSKNDDSNDENSSNNDNIAKKDPKSFNDLLALFNVKNDECRVCVDIKDWHLKTIKSTFATKDNSVNSNDSLSTTLLSVKNDQNGERLIFEGNQNSEQKKQCPLDIQELGRSTWSFLHTMSAYYPKEPSFKQQHEMRQFLYYFGEFYPCKHCAGHYKVMLDEERPIVDSRESLSQWLCRRHNQVNELLGKPLFDCKKIDERWRTGPSDGSCDS